MRWGCYPQDSDSVRQWNWKRMVAMNGSNLINTCIFCSKQASQMHHTSFSQLMLLKTVGEIHWAPCQEWIACLNARCRTAHQPFNTLRLRQNGRYFADDIFKYIFLNENAWISLKISLKFVPNVPIDNIPALVQIMAWRRPGDKPLSEPMMVSVLTHICVTRPQWVNSVAPGRCCCNFKWVIFKVISMIDIWSISCNIALSWMPQDLADD